MYDRHPCVTDDSYQLAYEHLRQMECAGHFQTSTEVSPFKLVSLKHQMSDGEKQCFYSKAEVGGNHICLVAKDMEFKKRTDDISSVNTASVPDRVLNSSLAADSSLGTEVVENGKRPSSYFVSEVVSKRARQANQVVNLERFDGNSFVIIPPEGNLSEEAECTRATAGVGANGKCSEAGNLTFPWLTSNAKEVATRLDQPARFSVYEGYDVDHRILGWNQLEDIYSQFSEHSHRRNVPVGPDHQADIPKWTSRDSMKLCSESGFYTDLAPGNATTSSTTDLYEASANTWRGTCVIPLPEGMEVRSCCSKIDCDCTDEGSIRCVRKHVMAAREKLSRGLGTQKFIEMGFSDMGEVVAQRWTEEEENLFHEVVLSNPASLGRNFWGVLRRAFSSRSFKELVSYYFNVFILRKRAHQNRFDCLNVDSDNDEWQESSDAEFAMSEEGEEEDDSVVESPDGNAASQHLVGTEEEEPKGFKSMPYIQAIDRNSKDCPEDQDVQDDSCTSYEGLHNVSGSCHGHVDGFDVIGLADYEYTDGANKKEIDFFPTCNVLEEVFGEGSSEKTARNGSGFS